MKKLYIKTFGCQMNEYDSGKMADLLHADEGMVMTDKPEDADVVLLNTCSIREKAEDKVYSDLGRLRELKKTKPNLLIGVGGCVCLLYTSDAAGISSNSGLSLRFHHGRLLQILQLLCCSLHTR